MADPSGFLKVDRAKAKERPPEERIQDDRELLVEPEPEKLRAQASRCMDCGIPFCHQGCPLGNMIPEWNDLVYRGKTELALAALLATNNFPEVTGRVCPAPCEASCVLNLRGAPVTIKDIERNLANASYEVPLQPVLAPSRSGKRVAVVGSGPAGLACAQQLARMGHEVVVLERDDRVGGLLRYGIPDFKLEKHIVDRRLAQMEAEGVVFRTGVFLEGERAEEELSGFSAVVLALGARAPRDLDVPGRDLPGVHFAMELLEQQNRSVAGAPPREAEAISVRGKRVVVIGGGDTGSDCVGTSNRLGAAGVVQLELMARPPLHRLPDNPWPEWPLVLRTSSSHEEGCERDFGIRTKALLAGPDGRVRALLVEQVELSAGALRAVPGTDQELSADLVLLAMGFVGPEKGLPEALGLERDRRGNVVTDPDGRTSRSGVFAAGDVSRGQSLVVWAIADGRRVARAVNQVLNDPLVGGRRAFPFVPSVKRR